MLPSSLLLLSRAFTLTQAPGGGGPPPDQGGSAAELDSLKNTLGALNKEVLDEVGLDVGQIGCGHARAHPGVTGPPACMPTAGRTDGRGKNRDGYRLLPRGAPRRDRHLVLHRCHWFCEPKTRLVPLSPASPPTLCFLRRTGATS